MSPVNETSLLLDPEAGVSLKTEPAATVGPSVTPGAGAAAAAAKAATGMDETSPSSTTGVGPCVKNPDGGMDC